VMSCIKVQVGHNVIMTEVQHTPSDCDLMDDAFVCGFWLAGATLKKSEEVPPGRGHMPLH
jgi:hypothetical protein